MLGTCLVRVMEYRPGLVAVKVTRVTSARLTVKAHHAMHAVADVDESSRYRT